MGKPDAFCFDLLRKQHNVKDVPLSKWLMVGDNLETDIMFGNKCGIDSLLVLSGVTSAEKAIRLHKGRGVLEGMPTHV